jgi:hypothetical protein
MIRQFSYGAGERKPSAAIYVVLLTVLTLLSIPAAYAQQVTRTHLSTSSLNGKLTLQATVSSMTNTPLNSGSVSFETSKGSLGSAFLKNGAASLTVSSLPAGVSTVTAVYHPVTSDYSLSTSTPAAVSADTTSTVASFNVTATPSSVTLTPGQYGTVLLTVNSVNGFAGTVDLSCSFLPATLLQEADCNFSPDTVALPANGSMTSSLQINTYAASGIYSSKSEMPFHHGQTYLALLLPGGFALFGMFALRRKNSSALRMMGVVALLAVCTAGLTACGARYGYLLHKPFPNPGTPKGSYTLVVSAYSSNGTEVQQATSSSGCSGAACIALTVQ